MHFAMPPRKTSRPPPYAARNTSRAYPAVPPALRNLLRRNTLRNAVLAVVGVLTLVWLFGRRGSGSSAASVIGTGPPVVVVTLVNPNGDQYWMQKIKYNRIQYAKKHGYLTFFPNDTAYPLRDAPGSWAKVPAMRHAMTLHPASTFFWYLDSTALIMDTAIPLTSHVLAPSRLESLMVVNEPVVPPDSVIKTFGNLKGERIDLVVTQAKDGLDPSSFIVRNGEWAKYFLDAWFDPIYRNYNFQKAETHALEHIVQWHGTILAKLAIVPQNILNSYVNGHGNANPKYGDYKDGDFVANFPGCDRDNKCPEHMGPFFEILARKEALS